MNTKQKQKLRKFVNELSLIRGRHTELVSVYIPAGYDIIKIIQHIDQEKGTASNIKDAKTRKNVQDSLEKIIRHLRLFKKTPPNGLAAFAGNIAAKEGKVDLKVWSIEPPEQLKTRIYRCDQTFLLDILKSMMESKEKYGLIVMDRREATLGLLQGTNIKKLTHMTSNVPGKTTKGGQCLNPEVIIDLKKGYKKLKDVRVGDILKAYNFKSKKLILTKCTNVWKVKKKLTLNFETENNHNIISSLNHIFFKFDGEKVKKIPAEELKIKDYLINYKGKKTKIIKLVLGLVRQYQK